MITMIFLLIFASLFSKSVSYQVFSKNCCKRYSSISFHSQIGRQQRDQLGVHHIKKETQDVKEKLPFVLQSSSSDSSVDFSSKAESKVLDSKKQRQQSIESLVAQLKRVLEREYLSFFNPMEREWYANDVTFVDPLTSFTGIDKYQSNVDMLSGRNLFGELLFGNDGDARIILHKVTGGSVSIDEHSNKVTIDDIMTRWTLQFIFKALPWKPKAQFSGVSKYKVVSHGSSGNQLQIIRQDDFWDSINLMPDGTGTNYQVVAKSDSLKHFISLLLPSGGLNAVSAAPEVAYQTLRFGRISNESKPMVDQYEVRRYPSFIGIEIPYGRRDEGFELLGTLTKGLDPLAPTFVTVTSNSKSMLWPLQYSVPGKADLLDIETIRKRVQENAENNDIDTGLYTISIAPEKVVAVGRFNDVIVESVVRKVQQQILELCKLDGLQVHERSDSSTVTFAQYNAVYSIGKRRSEVHVQLAPNGHPW